MKFYDLDTLVKPLEALPAALSANSDDDDGAAIDLETIGQFHSGLVLCHVSAATGAPSAISAVFTLEESDDDVTYAPVTGAAVTMTEAGIGKIRFLPNERKRYVRVNRAITLTAGSTPKLPNSVALLLGHGRNIPAS